MSFVKRSATPLSSLVCLLAMFLPVGLVAQNYTYINVDYPGSSFSEPEAVNDHGQVVGYYTDGAGIHGFYWDGTNYSSIDFPGNSGGTLADGINNAGVISGEYETNNGTATHGFVLENGVFTSYDYPGKDGLTNGMGINNNGDLTGFYNFGPNHGFLDDNGSFSSFDYPGATDTFPHALNDSNGIVGYYRINSNSPEGFYYANGTFTLIEYPDDFETTATGVNNAGVVVGYSGLNNGTSVAWLWQNGVFTAINSSASPAPNGINNNGQLVGLYYPSGINHGFLATPGVSSAPSQFVPIVPCRVVDTRNPNGTFGGPPISGGNSRSFPLPTGPCPNIPSSATAYALNVTLVPINHGRVRYLTIWPTGQTQPTVSTMNSDGRVKADAATVPAGTGGAVSVYVTDTTNVILDIDGYYISPVSGTLEFYPLTPCRVADTRSTQYPQGLGSPHLTGGTPRDFPMLNNTTCLPAGLNALAYSLNITAIPYQGSPLGYLEIWPTGFEPPNPVSTLNNPNAVTVANAAIVGAPPSGDITVYANDNTDLAIDINGYFAEAGSGLQLYTIPPCRVIDTRNGGGQGFTGTLSPPVNVTTSGCGIPSSAGAYVFNATAIPVPALGYLTLWPDGESQPGVSTLNAGDGSVTSNMAVVPNHGDGKVDAYAHGTTQLILDIAAYFAP